MALTTILKRKAATTLKSKADTTRKSKVDTTPRVKGTTTLKIKATLKLREATTPRLLPLTPEEDRLKLTPLKITKEELPLPTLEPILEEEELLRTKTPRTASLKSSPTVWEESRVDSELGSL